MMSLRAPAWAMTQTVLAARRPTRGRLGGSRAARESCGAMETSQVGGGLHLNCVMLIAMGSCMQL